MPNNETVGMSAELAICKFYEIKDVPEHLNHRASDRNVAILLKPIQEFNTNHPEIKGNWPCWCY